ncbi:hypothetical protein FQA39_LY18577 [Lamprigera yunnana]|nr:hypothetical protein FQA39_LY18577 [Lamprigera yunnana]
MDFVVEHTTSTASIVSAVDTISKMLSMTGKVDEVADEEKQETVYEVQDDFSIVVANSQVDIDDLSNNTSPITVAVGPTSDSNSSCVSSVAGPSSEQNQKLVQPQKEKETVRKSYSPANLDEEDQLVARETDWPLPKSKNNKKRKATVSPVKSRESPKKQTDKTLKTVKPSPVILSNVDDYGVIKEN